MNGILSLLRAAAGRELKRLGTPYVAGVLPEVLLLVPQLEELDIGPCKYADDADEYARLEHSLAGLSRLRRLSSDPGWHLGDRAMAHVVATLSLPSLSGLRELSFLLHFKAAEAYGPFGQAIAPLLARMEHLERFTA